MAEDISKDLGKKILKKLDNHNKLFEKLNHSLIKINGKLIDHDNRFDGLKTELMDFMLAHFDKIYGKLEKLEQEYAVLNTILKRLEERMEKVENRLGNIEEKMVTREEIAEMKAQTLDLLRRIEKLESKVGVAS